MSRDTIRKPRKALWVYECKQCGHTRSGVDMFSAIEAQQRHRSRTAMHHQWQDIRAQIVNMWDTFRREVGPALLHAQKQIDAFNKISTPPSDPKERALWAQQHRNTGPPTRHDHNPKVHRSA